MKLKKQKLIFLVPIALLAFFVCIYTVAAQSVAGFEIEYSLSVINPGQHTTRVVCVFKNFPNTTATLKLFHYQHPYIEDFSATNEDLGPLNVTKENDIYTVANGDSKNFSVTYDLKMDQESLYGGPMGHLNEKYLLSQTNWTFVEPVGIDAQKYTIVFDAPSGWASIAPWKKTGDKYVANKDNIQGTFALGQFDVRTKKINGTKTTIAVDNNFSSGMKAALFSNCFKIFKYYKSLFGARVPSEYLSILVKATVNDSTQWQFINENTYSSGEAVSSEQDAYYQFSHRVFHVFNIFNPTGMQTVPVWFSEGANEYYSLLAYTKIAFGSPFSGLQKKYEKYLNNEKRNNYDTPVADFVSGANYDKNDYVAYNKGALISFLLNEEIKKSTGGKKSLNNVMKKLFAKYGRYRGGQVTNEIIRQIASSVAGKDMSDFFNNYIYATGNIDLSDYIKDSDNDGINNAGENSIGTNANNYDTDGDLTSDYYEYQHGTSPKRLKSVSGSPIRADGFGDDWNKVKYNTFNDEESGNSCGTDVTNIDYFVQGNSLYARIRLKCEAEKKSNLRYFVNVDLNLDSAPDLQFASVFGASGDTSKFKANSSDTYDYKQMNLVPGLESGVSQVAEFKIPLSLLNNLSEIGVQFGVWDTKTSSGNFVKWKTIKISTDK